MTKVIAAYLVLFGISTASAQQTESFFDELTRYLRERTLQAECTSMGLLVNIQEKEPGDLGLTGDGAVAKMLESRLRAARLFTETPFSEKSHQELRVIITGVSIVFNVRLYLTRVVDDTGFGSGGLVSIWGLSSTGVHGGGGRSVLMAVSELVDDFVGSYLRANEKACAKK